MSDVVTVERPAPAVTGPIGPGRTVHSWAQVVGLSLLFVLALLPRLLGLGEVTTTDEDQWVLRSSSFVRALREGNWRATYQSGHPGVSVMWVTSLTVGPDRLDGMGLELSRGGRVSELAEFLPALGVARWAFALLGAALAVVCGLLAIRLFGWGAGLLAAVLLALDPYWSAMSPLLGMDSLLTGLLTTSLLTAVLAFQPTGRPSSVSVATTGRPRRWRWALLSGLLAGLALLTKSPALLLLPTVLLLAGVSLWSGRRSAEGVWSVITALAIWGGAIVLTSLLWPAFVFDPLATLERASRYTSNLGLLDRDVSRGPLFYPVALALRLGPAVLPGLMALLLLATTRIGGRSGIGRMVGQLGRREIWREGRTPSAGESVVPASSDAVRGRTPSPPECGALRSPGERGRKPSPQPSPRGRGGLASAHEGVAQANGWPLLGLVLFVVVFGLGISVGSKKLDRYALPLFPALTILAAVGWWVALARLRAWSQRSLVVPLGVGLAVLLQVSPLVAGWSAPLASYNPFLGGARTAERFMPVGWGEGLGPITDYLRAQPEAELRSVGIWNAMADNLQAHLPGPVVGISVSNRGQVNNERDFDQLDYYVDYVFARQQRMTPRELAGRTPELVSTIDGVAYARLYRLK